MDTRQFLQAVVPWDTDGYITIHWQRQGVKGLPGRSCQTLDDALKLIDELRSQPLDIYFCLSSQKLNSGHRSRENATALQCIWADMDVGPEEKKYRTVNEAIRALFRFCDELGIPRPSILVFSGMGVHAYWLSIRVLTVEEWQGYANALKTAAQEHGLKIDMGVTGDAARVLRVPGTANWKYGEPRPVELIEGYCSDKRYDFEEFFPSADVIQIADALKHLKPESMAEGIVVPEAPLLPLQPILDGCAWLREAHETGGKEFDQPQWNLTTLCATFMENGHAIAHEFGNQHPKYSVDTTDDIWERKNRERKSKNLGWPKCSSISGNGGHSHCKRCPRFARGKSPLHLGYEAIKDAVVDMELQGLGGSNPPSLRLPEGFVLDAKGQVCRFIASKVVKGKLKIAQLIPTILSKIREPQLLVRDGKMGINFIASTDRENHIDMFMCATDCVGAGLYKYVLSKGILYNTNIEEKGPRMTEHFTTSWLDKLQKEDVARFDSGAMGWRYLNGERVGFAYGGVMYHQDGTELPLINTSDDLFRSHYIPIGKREVWLEAAKLLTSRKRPELDAIIAIAFAAPLVPFVGTFYGAILSVYGEPGSSKSTAQQVAAAVWGHPKQTRESLNSSAKSVQGRLGRTRNLPAYWDDVQDERHQNALFDCMFVATQGAEGGRLNTDASMKERLEWQTMLVACSNASFVEYLIKKQRSTTAGIRRVFEFECNKRVGEPGIINSVDASNIFATLEHNYGRIGSEYARILGQEHKAIAIMVSDTTKEFMNEVGGSSDESFWWGICGTLVVGATMANRLGAEIDVPALRAFLVKAFIYNRAIRGQEGTEGGSVDNTVQSLTSFLNHYTGSGNILFVNKNFEHKVIPVKVLHQPGTGRAIYIQVARDTRMITVSKKALRDYLDENEIQSRQVLEGIKRFFHAKELKHTLGAGTVHAQTQEMVLEITVPVGGTGTIFDDLLVAWGEPVNPAVELSPNVTPLRP